LEKQLELVGSNRSGVGFRGMRERLRQLGGTLEMQSDKAGTVVIATLECGFANQNIEQIAEPRSP
jgi:signal transduction histidine kinase